MRVAWLAGLALVGLAAGPARGDEWSHRYPLKGGADLHVKTDDGSVRIETSDSPEIAARVTTEGWRIAPDEVTITESQSGDRVDIEVRLPKRYGFTGIGHRSVKVVLQVPKRADLDVRTGDGSVEVQPVSGRLSISTGDGSITVDGLQGEIQLHTGDGSIRATGLAGQLKADTGDGQLNVRGRFDQLDLSTGDGGIEAVVEPGSKVEKAWSLKSGDGGITLRVPEDLGAEIDAHTGDGHIELDKPISVTGSIGRSSVKGTLGAGGQPLRIHTGDGSIRLQRL
jgi:Putative adhesin